MDMRLIVKQLQKNKTYFIKKITLIIFFFIQGILFLGFPGIYPINIILSVPLFIISICQLSKNKKISFFSNLLLSMFTSLFNSICFLACIMIGLDNFLVPPMLICCIIDLIIVSKNMYNCYKNQYNDKHL